MTLYFLYILIDKYLKIFINKKNNNSLPDEGFEPSPPKRLDLKSSALDHSANRARNKAVFFVCWFHLRRSSPELWSPKLMGYDQMVSIHRPPAYDANGVAVVNHGCICFDLFNSFELKSDPDSVN